MAEPVTLEELKAWARVDDDADDDLIGDLGVAAREFVEQATGRVYVGTDAETIPEKGKTAIKMLAAHWMENREPVTLGSHDLRTIPMHVKSLIAQLRGGVLEPAEATT